MTDSAIGAVVFFALALCAVGGAAGVAFSQNIVHSAFSLLAAFLGVAGLYAWAAADLVAVIQLLVYVGGVLVLILFAVMLTSRIGDVNATNRSIGLLPGIVLLIGVAAMMIAVATRLPWPRTFADAPEPTAAAIGNALLGPYVLPFEVVSLLLLAALVGAVVLARGSKPRGGAGGGR